MDSLSSKAKVDANGIINLQLPKQLANRELDLVVVYQLIDHEKTEDIHQIVDSFYGCLEDDPILVESQSQKEIA